MTSIGKIPISSRSAVEDKDSLPDPMISTDLTLQDGATRDDTSKRKARSIHMHTDSEHTAKRPKKNKQDRPAMRSASVDSNPVNDEDRKPAAKNASPTPDGVPSTCPGFKRKSTSTRTESVVSTSAQGIKLEPVIKTEPVPATETAPVNTSTDRAEASIPTETAINGPHQNPLRTVTLRRKAAKRSESWHNKPPPLPQNIAVPLPLSPQTEGIPARKKPRVEEPLPTMTVTEEAARETASPDISERLPPPADIDGDANIDSATDTPLSTPARKTTRHEDPLLPLHRSSRHVNTTCSTATSAAAAAAAAAPPNANVVTSTLRRSSCQTPRTDTSEEQLDDDDEDANPDNDDDAANAAVGDLPGLSWEDRLGELAVFCKAYGYSNIPNRYSENTKLARWVTNQRTQYKLHLAGKKSNMTTLRIQELERMGFEWDRHGAAWAARLSELVAYRKMHLHCNVPRNYSENTKLGKWVANQRVEYKLQQEGKTSFMTLLRIQELEGMGFEWDSHGAAWKDRLSELANYRQVHGHCNVPQKYRKMSSRVIGS